MNSPDYEEAERTSAQTRIGDGVGHLRGGWEGDCDAHQSKQTDQERALFGVSSIRMATQRHLPGPQDADIRNLPM